MYPIPLQFLAFHPLQQSLLSTPYLLARQVGAPPPKVRMRRFSGREGISGAAGMTQNAWRERRGPRVLITEPWIASQDDHQCTTHTTQFTPILSNPYSSPGKVSIIIPTLQKQKLRILLFPADIIISDIIISHLQKQLHFRKVQHLSQSHMSVMWQSWDLNPGLRSLSTKSILNQCSLI